MTPEQALKIIDQATQPGVQLTRADYALVHQALLILERIVKEQTGSDKPVPPPVQEGNKKAASPE